MQRSISSGEPYHLGTLWVVQARESSLHCYINCKWANTVLRLYAMVEGRPPPLLYKESRAYKDFKSNIKWKKIIGESIIMFMSTHSWIAHITAVYPMPDQSSYLHLWVGGPWPLP